jgi:sporulation protein YlmC with PRC-barrel domain
MHDQFIASIREHMDVYDINGDKVGTVGKIYQPAAVNSASSTFAEPTGRSYLKVDTGFMGLGKDLYIPADAISDVMADRVTIAMHKDTLDAKGWDHKPDFLRD